MTHVTRWTSTDVADWLEQCLHLPGQSFREADIDGAKLLGLDEQQLHSLGLEDAQVTRLQSHISAFRAVGASGPSGPRKAQGFQGPVKLHLGAKPDPVCLTPRDTGDKTRTHRTPRTRRTHSLERASGAGSPGAKTSKVRSSSLGSQPRIRSQARPARQHVHSAPQELMEFSRQIRQLQADLRDKETAKILEQGRSRPSRPRSRPRSRARSSQSSPTKQTPRTPLTPQTPGPFGARERTETPSQLDRATSFVPLKRGQEQYKLGPANRQKQRQKPPRPKLASQKVSPAKPVPKTDQLAAESVESVEPEETPRLTGEELMPLALKIVEAAQQPEEGVEVKQPEEKTPLTGEELMPLALKIVEAAQHTEERPEVKEPESLYLTGAELMPLALKIVETAMGKGDDQKTSDLENPKDVFNLLAELSQGLDGSELQISQVEAEEAWRQPSLEQLSSELEAAASQFGTTATMTPTATMSSVSMSPGRVSSKSGRPFNALKEYLHPACSCQKAAERAVPCLSHCGPTVKSHDSKGFKFSKVARKEVRSVSPYNGVYTPRFRAHIPGGTFPTASRWQVENRANLLFVCKHVQLMNALHILHHGRVGFEMWGNTTSVHCTVEGSYSCPTISPQLSSQITCIQAGIACHLWPNSSGFSRLLAGVYIADGNSVELMAFRHIDFG